VLFLSWCCVCDLFLLLHRRVLVLAAVDKPAFPEPPVRRGASRSRRGASSLADSLGVGGATESNATWLGNFTGNQYEYIDSLSVHLYLYLYLDLSVYVSVSASCQTLSCGTSRFFIYVYIYIYLYLYLDISISISISCLANSLGVGGATESNATWLGNFTKKQYE